MRYVIYILFTFSFVWGYSQQISWKKEYGGYGQDFGYCIVYNNDNYFAGGNTLYDSTNNIGSSAFIRINGFGDTSFIEKHNGTFLNSTISDVAVRQGSENVYAYISRPLSNNYVSTLAKFDLDGNLIWQREFNGGGILTSPAHLHVLPDESIILASERGDFSSYIEIYVMRWDKDGNLMWEQDYVKGGYEYVDHIDVLWDGSLLLSGRAWASTTQDMYYLNIDVDGNKIRDGKIYPDSALNTHQYSNMIIKQLSNDEFIATTWDFNLEQRYLLKLDSGFNPIWMKTIENVHEPFEMEGSNLLAVGNSKNNTFNHLHGAMVVFDWSGNVQKTVYDTGVTFFNSVYYNDIAFNDKGSAVIGGTVDRYNTQERQNFYFVKYDNVGTPYKKSNHCRTPPQIYWVSAAFNGDTVVMSDQSEAFLKYNKEVYKHWYLQDGRHFIGDSLHFTFDQQMFPDTFWVGLVIFDGIYCSDTVVINAYTNEVLPNYVGVEEKAIRNDQVETITIYPNPAKDEFRVNVSNHKNLRNIRLELYDGLGRIQPAEFRIQNSGIVVNSTKLERGIYYLLLRNEEGLKGKGKVVVE